MPSKPGKVIRSILLSQIRKDGDTQHRHALNRSVVVEWANQLRACTVFPPVTVWWDGDNYWLSDGFHRVAAAEEAGLPGILAEVIEGSLYDAQWDSYGANVSRDCIQRNKREISRVIHLALNHAYANTLSTVALAKHLGIPEATMRYWRNKLMARSQLADDRVRQVTRGNVSYTIDVTNIGRQQHSRESSKCLLAGIADLKRNASGSVVGLLNIIERWERGQITATRLGEVLEAFIHRLQRGNRLVSVGFHEKQ